MSKHIVLEGFMGSGKTTVGIRLSYKMAMTVADTDKLIEKEQQKKYRTFLPRTARRRSGKWRPNA